MKLIIKERIFSWFDSYDVYDEHKKTAFTVKGKLAWGHMLVIYDKDGEKVGKVEEKIISLLPKYEIFENGESLGCIRKDITLVKPKYSLDSKGWTAKGDIVQWNYKIVKDKKVIATISRKLIRLKDTYVIEVENDKDALRALMFVLAIDAERCSKEKKEERR